MLPSKTFRVSFKGFLESVQKYAFEETQFWQLFCLSPQFLAGGDFVHTIHEGKKGNYLKNEFSLVPVSESSLWEEDVLCV